MKLRNKKTGEIGYTAVLHSKAIVVMDENAIQLGSYTSLAELTEEWEDAPEEPKEFWFVDSDGEVRETNYLTGNDKVSLRNFANYFETKEEAEKAVEKLKAWKQLKDKGFGFRKWDWLPDQNIICGNIGFYIKDYIVDTDDLDLLFGGEE